ncbi:hypothetical protein [Streptomyces poonensis]|uniref:Uncharacterized protein n=1 Tax=Streptomyces poonensis TaxID=68255 RepID=A0A918UVE0_9ACTN|nr:hypothetical protein [Streptomyces poonensis]GGZ37064.1 hypothetical protein GCM10010365_67390 [Streptomyces poonensis]GLJ90140.1 hypothetical protein GCM10017589_27410 [Streptomyces poonensis]
MKRSRRRTPKARGADGDRGGVRRAGQYTAWAGRLLCWTLAGAMLTAAAEALLAPDVTWWRVLWPLPWCLVPVWALTWAALRIREKRLLRRAADEEPTPTWDTAA